MMEGEVARVRHRFRTPDEVTNPYVSSTSPSSNSKKGLKMKFSPNDRVYLFNTSDPQMDGLEGYVTGVASYHPEMTVYIVSLDAEFDVGYGKGWTSLAITEHCLEAV